MMEYSPAFFVAYGTDSPNPYAANGPAERSANANRFSVTRLILNNAIPMLMIQITTLLIRVDLMIF